MFVWIVGLAALTVISGIFGYTGLETPSTDVAVFLFQVFAIATVGLIAWIAIHRHERVIGHDLHRHI